MGFNGTYDDVVLLAKRWGRANGYEGREGGWIFRAGGRAPVCQGWYAFAQMNRRRILDSGRPERGAAVQRGFDLLAGAARVTS